MKEDSFCPVLPEVLGFLCNSSKRGVFASLAIVGVEALEKQGSDVPELQLNWDGK